MPSSRRQNITELMSLIVQLNPSEVLDLGAGTGKYGFQCREYLDVWAGRTFKKKHKAYWYLRDFRQCGYRARVINDRNINAIWLAPGVRIRCVLIDKIKEIILRKKLRYSRLG